MGINEEERNLRDIAKRDLEVILKKFVGMKNPDSNGFPKAIIIPVSFVKHLIIIILGTGLCY